MATIDTLGVLEQSAVYKVTTIFLDDIHQAKAELNLRDELEKGQIDVAPHSNFQIKVKRFEPQSIMFAGSEVNHRVDTSDEIGTEVVVAWCCELQVNRHGDISALEDLCTVYTTKLLVIDGMLLTKVDGGRNTQREVIVQAKVTKYAHRKAWAVVVNLRIPLFSCLRVYVAVILQLDVLHMKTKEEAIMKAPLVDIWAVLYLTLLCSKAQDEDKHGE